MKGIHRVKRPLCGGRTRYHYYAWRSGPRFWTCDDTPIDPAAPPRGFIAAWQKHFAEHQNPGHGTLHRLVHDWKKSQSFLTLSAAMRGDYARYADRILDKFGAKTSMHILEDPRMRRHIIKWRDAMAATPRAADLAVATLSRLYQFGYDQGVLTRNHAANIPALHKVNRAHIIWEPAEIEAFCQIAPDHLIRAIHFAALTGLSRADLITIPWWADKGDRLEWKRAKSRGQNWGDIIIPITAALRALMQGMPRYPGVGTILTNSRAQSWGIGFSASFNKARTRAGVNKRLHDLRGTAATHFIRAGLNDMDVAEIMGWKVAAVSAIRRRYVTRSEVISAAIHRLNKTQKEQKL
ncbi:MAG: hypothetical protein COB49_02045 [Alphaproteobacteria bacterium]|nr:MAG: hypothetical protein COB49_02045 [Alphaproteobacteria bacterium]